MKKTVLALAFATTLSAPAVAGNGAIEDALSSREDLSIFYNALVNTGVINELSGTMPYTVFAPTNDAFAELTPEEYPCLYSTQCQDELRDILRNHIVPHERQLDNRSGMFSIDDRHIAIAEPQRGNYLVNGVEVISKHQLGGGVLYKIDEILADEREMATFTRLKFIPMASSVTTVTERTYVAPSQPGGYTQTTTTTTRTIQPADLSPAAGY